jgi:peptidoglycan/LPS O-acetylase OafA/YrhL
LQASDEVICMTNSFSNFLEKFRRITSAGNYIPEIDGLRFVAIFWVVVWMHLPTILNVNLFNGKLITNSYLAAVILEGGHGVSFFFMISGFILALPFIKEKALAGPPVSLRKYYLRRLSRLEPPYLAALIIAFILLIIVKNKSFSDLLPHFGASSIYMHNLIYNGASSVLGVAWSLEVEVQFYILAPFLCFIFLIRHHVARRFILVLLILLSGVYAYYSLWKMPTMLPYFICYFLSGMLLADLYCSGHQLKLNTKTCFISGVIIFIGLPFIISVHSIWFFLLKLFLMIAAFYLVLFNEALKKMMSRQVITIIGGMCYSIYLLHLLIMVGVSKGLLEMPLLNSAGGVVIYSAVLMAAVLLFSAIFYRLIEQPCMRKDWWKRIFVRNK